MTVSDPLKSTGPNAIVWLAMLALNCEEVQYIPVSMVIAMATKNTQTILCVCVCVLDRVHVYTIQISYCAQKVLPYSDVSIQYTRPILCVA